VSAITIRFASMNDLCFGPIAPGAQTGRMRQWTLLPGLDGQFREMS
jgi:hypothetical protein